METLIPSILEVYEELYKYRRNGREWTRPNPNEGLTSFELAERLNYKISTIRSALKYLEGQNLAFGTATPASQRDDGQNANCIIWYGWRDE